MKLKQILAIIAVIALVGMYAATVIFAFFDNTKTLSFLAASLALTAFIPALIWIIRMFVGLSSPSKEKDEHSGDDTE